MKRIIISTSIFILITTFIVMCFFSWYERRSILDFSKEEGVILVEDTTYIEFYVSNEGNHILATVNFKGWTDQIKISALSINVRSVEHPEQAIIPLGIQTYKFPVNEANLEYVSANSFESLPEFYKTVTPHEDRWNILMYYFDTNDIDSSEHYLVDVVGYFEIGKRTVEVKKLLTAKRKKAFRRIRMMN